MGGVLTFYEGVRSVVLWSVFLRGLVGIEIDVCKDPKYSVKILEQMCVVPDPRLVQEVQEGVHYLLGSLGQAGVRDGID